MKKSLLYAGIIALILTLSFSAAKKTGSANAVSENVPYEKMDAYLEKQLDLLNVPGGSLVVVEGDQIVHTKGFGTTGLGDLKPTPKTPYFIGSITKSVTALAVMQLVEEGKIELDAPVQKYLPWFTMKDPAASSQITVRYLLIQTSGISQLPGMTGLANFDDSPNSSEKQMRALLDEDLAHPVGTKWEYSNVNFNLLGLIIEEASGLSYADYIEKNIFSPLQMNHSSTDKEVAQLDGLAVGHQQWFGFPVPVADLKVPTASLASGQLISSAEDMGHYLIAQMNQGEFADQQLLSAQGVAQMHYPSADTGVGMSYGMGWFVDETSAGKLVYHFGEVPDSFAYTAFLPEHDLGLALLVNTNQHLYTYALLSMAENVVLMLAGIPPQSTAWTILPWALRALLLLPLVQSILIFFGFRRLKGWLTGNNTIPGHGRLWLLHFIPQTLANLLLVAGVAAFLASGMLEFSMLFFGDITSVILLCGIIALVWIIIRTVLIIRIMRKTI